VFSVKTLAKATSMREVISLQTHGARTGQYSLARCDEKQVKNRLHVRDSLFMPAVRGLIGAAS
jgi:hypothetical protein